MRSASSSATTTNQPSVQAAQVVQLELPTPRASRFRFTRAALVLCTPSPDGSSMCRSTVGREETRTRTQRGSEG